MKNGSNTRRLAADGCCRMDRNRSSEMRRLRLRAHCKRVQVEVQLVCLFGSPLNIQQKTRQIRAFQVPTKKTGSHSGLNILRIYRIYLPGSSPIMCQYWKNLTDIYAQISEIFYELENLLRTKINQRLTFAQLFSTNRYHRTLRKKRKNRPSVWICILYPQHPLPQWIKKCGRPPTQFKTLSMNCISRFLEWLLGVFLLVGRQHFDVLENFASAYFNTYT